MNLLGKFKGRMWLWLSLVALPCSLAAQTLMTQAEGLARAFPNAERVQRQTVFLTAAQVAAIEKLAGAKLESQLVTFYTDSTANGATAYAFFERHRVRTKDEVYMVVVNPAGTVRAVEMLAFYEPMDYFPPVRWLKLFGDKPLTEQLWPSREIHNLTGATLTARAVTLGVRRILAIYQVAIAAPRKSRS